MHVRPSFARVLAAVAATAVVGAFAVPAAEAVTITDSSSFSVGFGYTGSYSTTETSSVNTPTAATNGVPFTVGNFSYTITAITGCFGSVAPTFPNRVLTAGDATGLAGSSSQTTVSVTATYVGPPL